MKKRKAKQENGVFIWLYISSFWGRGPYRASNRLGFVDFVVSVRRTVILRVEEKKQKKEKEDSC